LSDRGETSTLQIQAGGDEELAARIESWLLHRAQVWSGPHRGAAVGGFESGRPNYAYGEITGYYLIFLAFVARSGRPKAGLDRRAQEALRWLLGEWSGNEVPATRVYLEGPTVDWRNHLIFSFDLAMILRGLHLAAEAELINIRESDVVITRVIEALLRCVGPDGALQACIARDPGSLELPVGWSTRSGPFQLKTAAAVLSARSAGLPASLETAARVTFRHWRSRIMEAYGASEMHPLLYGIEGLVMLGRLDEDGELIQAAARKLTITLDEYLAHADRAAVQLRSDVIAQALRLACVLSDRGNLKAADRNSCEAVLCRHLRDFVDADGAVSFERTSVSKPRAKNTWSAMFAYQALRFKFAVGSSDPLPWPMSLMII
jgi:hypothetical protein